MAGVYKAGTLYGQKAPSAIRCIKTEVPLTYRGTQKTGQKAPSAIRCIKTPSSETPEAAPEAVRKHRAP